MSFCSFADGAAMFDATPIENLFLMEYMNDASAPALKVYLYARMLALHPELGGTMADLSKALRISEDEVYNAFTYWENRGLVRRLTDQPSTYAFQPMRSELPSTETLLDREMYANRDFNNRLRQLFGDEFIGQHELRKAGDWQTSLHYDQDAILRMVAYCIEQSPRKNPKPPSVFKRVDKLAEEWSRRGIHTLEGVEKAIDEARDDVTPTLEAVFRKLGINRRDYSEPEREAARRWVREWGFTREDILDACDATLSARNPTVNYLNAILERRLTEQPGAHDALVAVLRELNPKHGQPTDDDKARYQALLDQGFEPEMIRLAAVQCHRANKYHFDDLIWRLNLWHEDGVLTPEAAEVWMKQMTGLKTELRRVYRQAGYSDRTPSDGDVVTYRGWKETYPGDMILYAAECARGKGGSMAYMEKLLTQWTQDGAATAAQARAMHEAWRQTSGSGGNSGVKPANPALDYAQRDYRDEDFGDGFYFDYDKVFGSEEGKK